jgi:hypothetical protein
VSFRTTSRFTASLAVLGAVLLGLVAPGAARADARAAIVSTAAHEVGVLEGSTRANSYGAAVGRSDSTHNYAWCATFVSWVMSRTGATAFRSAAVGDWVTLAREHHNGLTVVSVPVAGDLVAFDWDGNGDYAYPHRHIGIVEKPPTSAGTFTTIEGNTSKPGDASTEGVFRKTRSTRSKYTVTFIRVGSASTVPPVQSDPAAPAGWYRQDLGVPVDVGTAVASQAAGSLDVFYLRGGALQQHYYRGTGSWTAAPSLGAPAGRTLTGRVAAVSQAAGSLDVFARATDGTLWQKYYRNGAWAAWVRPVAGTIQSNPSVVSMAAGRLDVFAVNNGKVVQTYFAGGKWYPWRTLSIALPAGTTATFEGAPAVASGADRRIDLVVRDTTGRVWASYFGGNAFSPWRNLTASVTLRAMRSDSLGASSWGPGRLDVFVATTNGYTWHTYRYTEGGAFAPWQNMATSGKGPSAASWSAGRVDTFYRSNAGTLAHDWYARY